MHGINRSLFLQPGSAAPRRAGARAEVAARETSAPSAYRMRNLLREPRAAETFSAGRLVEKALSGTTEPLRVLMRKLARRIGRERWETPVCADSGVGIDDNPHIHSGYTYLLQIVAHDISHSSLSLAGTAMGGVGLANTRIFPLTLETIYGGGPDVCPHPYEMDPAVLRHIGRIPRTRFRLGQIRKPDRTMTGCPFRDIPRAVPAQVQDSGLSAGQGASPSDPWRTEALLADVRNDDHALISQMTALFHTLHNHVIDMIPTTGALAALSPTEREYRRFLCARFVVTLIYRNIIVKDLLALILHPDVYAHYVTANAGLLDGHDADAADSTPVEFTSAVFRFAHAMVRDTYKVNDENSPLSFSDALELSSLRKPSNLPVDTNWAIDWSRFFQIGERVPNHSHRIGPVYTSGALTNSSIFEKLTPLDEDGLPNRDLLTGCFSGLWSVRALSRELRARGLDKLLPDYESWKPIVRDWLAKPAGLFDFDPLSPAEIDILAEDPPLLLFTLIEAGQPIRQATGPINGAAGESLHLGALGSIVVAETILGSLKRAPIAFETAGPHVQDRIREACRTLLDDAGALDSIPEIASMPKLLEYMSDTGALPRQPGGTHIARLNMEERRMPELRERFSVNDEIKWGKLVKSFATGNNYLVENGAPIPLPRTIDDLKTLCANLGIVITMPDYHKGLVIIQSSEEVFSIRLPPKTMVEEMEQFLKDGGKYASPKFYDDFYGTTLTLTTEKEKLDFHAARIGDYSVRMCL